MKFTAQLKEIKRLSTVSNDVEFTIKLITEQNISELCSVGADELVKVSIEYEQNK